MSYHPEELPEGCWWVCEHPNRAFNEDACASGECLGCLMALEAQRTSLSGDFTVVETGEALTAEQVVNDVTAALGLS